MCWFQVFFPHLKGSWCVSDRVPLNMCPTGWSLATPPNATANATVSVYIWTAASRMQMGKWSLLFVTNSVWLHPFCSSSRPSPSNKMFSDESSCWIFFGHCDFRALNWSKLTIMPTITRPLSLLRGRWICWFKWNVLKNLNVIILFSPFLLAQRLWSFSGALKGRLAESYGLRDVTDHGFRRVAPTKTSQKQPVAAATRRERASEPANMVATHRRQHSQGRARDGVENSFKKKFEARIWSWSGRYCISWASLPHIHPSLLRPDLHSLVLMEALPLSWTSLSLFCFVWAVLCVRLSPN